MRLVVGVKVLRLLAKNWMSFRAMMTLDALLQARELVINVLDSAMLSELVQVSSGEGGTQTACLPDAGPCASLTGVSAISAEGETSLGPSFPQGNAAAAALLHGC